MTCYQAQLISEAKARRARLMSLCPKAIDEPVISEPEPEPEPVEECADAQPQCEPSKPTGRSILIEVALEHGLTVTEMVSDRRLKRLVLARWHSMWRMSKETSLSLSQIGGFHNRDHTTVMYGIEQYQDLIDKGLA